MRFSRLQLRLSEGGPFFLDKLDDRLFRGKTVKIRAGTSRPAMAVRKAVFAGVIALLLLAALAGSAWLLSGGRLLVITTPSMSPKLPVGSLAAVQPASFPLHVGEVVAFRPNGSGITYVHQIQQIRVVHGMAFYRTKGILNGSEDPWLLTRRNILGEVVWYQQGLGWLLRCLPWFLVFFTLSYGTLRWLRAIDSVAFFASLDLAAFGALMLIHPLLQVHDLTMVAVGHSEVRGWVVNNGLLDAVLRYNGSLHLLRAGHALHFTAFGPHLVSKGGIARVSVRVHLRLWQLFLAVGALASPTGALLVSRALGRSSDEDISDDGASPALAA